MTRTVGRYEVLGELGRGGMATVHLARQPELDRLIALKEMTAIGGDRESLVKRFVRESRLAGALSHPNIVTVYDFFEHEGTPYIAMEYVAAGSLRPQLRALTHAQKLFVLASILSGLIHAEEHGVVHRDLKPENVLVSAGGRVKITDFGVAKATRTYSTALTGVGMTVGTPGYMAPEQAMAQPVGPWTDLYAVGCMAYELFAGQVPFADSEGPMAILMRHVSEAIPPLEDVDPAMAAWVASLTARDPGGRVQSAQDAWDALEAIAVALLGPRWERDARLNRSSAPAPATPSVPALVFETYVPRVPPRPPVGRDDAEVAPPAAPSPPADTPSRAASSSAAGGASPPASSPPGALTQPPLRPPPQHVPAPARSFAPIVLALLVIVAIAIVVAAVVIA